MRNITIDDENDFDEHGVLKDGHSRSYSLFMMDSIQREIASDQRARAAFKETNEMTKADPRVEAFAAQSRYLADAWKTKNTSASTPPKVIATGYAEQAARAPVEKSLGELQPNFYSAHPPGDRTGVNRPRDMLRKTTDARDAAYAEQGQRLRDAWKYPNAARRAA